MGDHDRRDGARQTDHRSEEQHGRERQDKRFPDAERVAHVHRPLEKAGLALEAVPADRAGGIHREHAAKHPPLETHGAALPHDGAQACDGQCQPPRYTALSGRRGCLRRWSVAASIRTM